MNELTRRIREARRVAFFGGAGVSTASGIPDFRSSEGLFMQRYQGLTPEMILSHSFFFLHPDIFFEYYRTVLVHPDAQPNAAHRVLAEMERRGKLTALITQNIDGLHRKAGNRLVYEIHGTIHENRCMDCGHPYSLRWLMECPERVPHCPECGGVVKPEVTLYGEAPDHYAMTGACREISGSDLLIVAGTSLEVEPAAGCLEYFHGRTLVVINREPVRAEERADLVLRGNVEEVFQTLDLSVL